MEPKLETGSPGSSEGFENLSLSSFKEDSREGKVRFQLWLSK